MGLEDKNLKEALKKRAQGFEYEEIVEEFDDTGQTLLKRKVTTKYMPPDIAAIKAYREQYGGGELSAMTDSELEAARKDLAALLTQKLIND